MSAIESFPPGYNVKKTRLPGGSGSWVGRMALCWSFLWVSMLVMVVDRQWRKATFWAFTTAAFAAVGIIHVPVAGFKTFKDTIWQQCDSVTECWTDGNQWQYFVAYILLAGTFAIIDVFCTFVKSSTLDPPIEDESTIEIFQLV